MASIDMGNITGSDGVAAGRQASASSARVTVNISNHMRRIWRRRTRSLQSDLPPLLQNETLHEVQQGIIRALVSLEVRIDSYQKANDQRWRTDQIERRASLIGLAILIIEASHRWGWW